MIKRMTLVLALLAAGTAHAKPPPGADPSLSPWFNSLRAPDTGIPCCSITDCRPTDYRTSGDHYEAMLNNRWISVPKSKVLQRMDNPTGRGILCYSPALGVMCFVRGPET